ncbi:hypothetical protein BKA64DRAFT_715832 [Cadophora sp. MPI-SDFR-AT-0126]|nr:hypothetical protein BKA64DRAFT_715832 [Leotiomycetes sp. MPI-SDFR-AT-0126]
MQLLTILLSIMLITLTTSMVRAGLMVVDEIPAGYKLGKMGFHGTIDGHEITYNGTIEEVLAHAETLHPGITKSLAARDDVPLLDNAALTFPNVATRDTQTVYAGPADGKGMRYCGEKSGPGCPICDEWGYVEIRRINEGISYLNKVNAFCRAPPQTCVRVSCSWHSGIFLCNDHKDTLESPCNWISTFANDVVTDEHCKQYAPHRTWPAARGQQWAGNKPYNVVVRILCGYQSIGGHADWGFTFLIGLLVESTAVVDTHIGTSGYFALSVAAEAA